MPIFSWPTAIALESFNRALNCQITAKVLPQSRTKNNFNASAIYATKRRAGMDTSKRFLKDESGAVTVDWVVLTAGVAFLGLLAMAPIRTAVVSMAGYIGETVDEYHGLLGSEQN
jgi:Flp pilus assembly pilin Flp